MLIRLIIDDKHTSPLGVKVIGTEKCFQYSYDDKKVIVLGASHTDEQIHAQFGGIKLHSVTIVNPTLIGPLSLEFLLSHIRTPEPTEYELFQHLIPTLTKEFSITALADGSL